MLLVIYHAAMSELKSIIQYETSRHLTGSDSPDPRLIELNKLSDPGCGGPQHQHCVEPRWCSASELCRQCEFILFMLC